MADSSENNSSSSGKFGFIANNLIGITKGSSALAGLFSSYANFQSQKQQFLAAADTFGINAQKAKKEGIENAEAIRKSNAYKLGRDKVSYGVSGVVGGSKLQALADNALTREMNAVRAQTKAIAKEEELRAAEKVAKGQARQANLFSYLSPISQLADTASFFLSTPQATIGTDQQSEYLGF